MKLKKNLRERKFQIEASQDGWEILTKGYPDFLLYKEQTNEALFVEIKRKTKKNNTGLSRHQKRMIEILKNIGLNVRVIYID